MAGLEHRGGNSKRLSRHEVSTRVRRFLQEGLPIVDEDVEPYSFRKLKIRFISDKVLAIDAVEASARLERQLRQDAFKPQVLTLGFTGDVLIRAAREKQLRKRLQALFMGPDDK